MMKTIIKILLVTLSLLVTITDDGFAWQDTEQAADHVILISIDGFRPDFANMHTGLVAWGSGIRKGVQAPVVGLENVAPLVAELLGLEFSTSVGLTIPGFLSGQ